MTPQALERGTELNRRINIFSAQIKWIEEAGAKDLAKAREIGDVHLISATEKVIAHSIAQRQQMIDELQAEFDAL